MRWLFHLHLLPFLSASNNFCVPAPPINLQQPTPTSIGGPTTVQAALSPYLRRCLYLHLPQPQETYVLELCLLKSARVFDEKSSFSIFLGYFAHWGESIGSVATHEYVGGNTWSCKGARERSITLRIACSSGGEAPAITQWLDDECVYEAHLLLPGSC